MAVALGAARRRKRRRRRPTLDAVIPTRNLARAAPAIASLNGLAKKVVVIKRDEWGFTPQVEEGWRQTTAPFVLFLNDDCVVNAGNMGALMAPMIDPKVGIVGPTMTCGDFQSNPWAARVPLKGGFLPLYISVRHLIGACLLVRRSMLEEIGGWDTDMVLHCSDLDLCIRAWDAGYRVIWACRMVVEHESHTTIKEIPQEVFDQMAEKDSAVFRAKHPNERMPPGRPRAQRRFGRAVYQAALTGESPQTAKGADNAYGQYLRTRNESEQLQAPEPYRPPGIGAGTVSLPPR